MPPLLNELFQEATAHSTAFASKAQAATAEVTEIAQAAEALGKMAVDEAETLHQAMAGVLGALHTAREELEAEAGRTVSVLHGLPARAETTQVAVEALLADVHGDVTHLSELRVRLLASVDESAQLASTELDDLETRVHELQQKLDARLNEANDHVEKLQHAVDDGRTHLAEEELHLREAIQSLGVLATDKAHAFVASVQAALLVL